MKPLFGIIGLLIGFSINNWSGGVFGLIIGILSGALIEYQKRLSDLEETVRQINANLPDSRTITPPDRPQPPAKPETVNIAPEQQVEDLEVAAQTTVTPAPEVPARTLPVSGIGTSNDVKPGSESTPSSPPVRQTDYINPALAWLKNFFTTGNVVVKVGMVVLFFGLSFLVKYAVDRNAFPIELRYAAVAVVGIVILIVGWRLRLKKPKYALVLQGGAVGILYLTVFSAAKVSPPIFPLSLAFVIMLGLVVFSGMLAVLQNSRSLAIFASAGGFLAPILTSTGHGNHVMLFSYYAVLNAGILGIAWYKAWRPLNLVGFAFTFVIASLWGSSYYQPGYFNSTEPFLILFFLFYVAISILFAYRQPRQLKGIVDGTLVFGVPLVGFTLQSAMVHDYKFGMAYSAITAAVMYIVLARILWNRQIEGMRMLCESFLALGVIFASLAIPFALDGRWTAAAWAIEGAGMTWIGIRQKRLSPRIFGLMLHVGGALAFAAASNEPRGMTPVFNSSFIGSIMISFAGLFSGWQFWKYREDVTSSERGLHTLLLIWGLCWWFGAWLFEIDLHVAAGYKFNTVLLLLAASALFIFFGAGKFSWPAAGGPPQLLLPLMVMFAMYLFLLPSYSYPFANYGYISWISAFAVNYFLLRRNEPNWPQQLLAAWHCLSLWLLIFICAWTVEYLISMSPFKTGTWSVLSWGFIPSVFALVLLHFQNSISWPVRHYKNYYLGTGLLPVIIFIAGWVVVICFCEGDPAPLTYLPILNPQDIAQLFAMLVLADWTWRQRRATVPGIEIVTPEQFFNIFATIVFIWINSLVAHIIHFYAGVRYTSDAIFRSSLFQTSISIIWTLVAFILMGISTRKGKRKSWFAGAGLLAVVVVKLFFIDLADSGTVTRIVSFISVGGLMLVIGYLSPVPPKRVLSE